MVIESAEEHAISLRGVPVIDVSPLIRSTKANESNNNQDGGSEQQRDPECDRVVKEIGDACRNWGFYYATGHGIPTELIQALKDQAREFIEKPKEFKRKILRQEDNICGYFDNEFTKQTLDWKEGWDIQSVDGDIEKPGIHGFSQWPEGMPEFRTTITNYFHAAADLAHELTRALWLGLGGDTAYVDKQFRNRHTTLFRINYYSPCPDPGAYLGVGPHTDAGAVTVLLQDEGVNSLQVQRHGVWYNVPPVEGSFVINTGDMFQVWSNGLYQAPTHRVLANKGQERYSFPLFYQPSYDTMYAPLEQTITAEKPARYRPINWGHFRSQRFAGDYADLGEEIQIQHYEIKS